jgi:hypothetical protein
VGLQVTELEILPHEDDFTRFGIELQRGTVLHSRTERMPSGFDLAIDVRLRNGAPIGTPSSSTPMRIAAPAVPVRKTYTPALSGATLKDMSPAKPAVRRRRTARQSRRKDQGNHSILHR